MSVRNHILVAAIRFLYRRIKDDGTRIPTGVPTIRDPDARCDYYSPRRQYAGGGGWGGCHGDGHYLCRECERYEPEESEREP
ncbi:MAG: hypothetical protein ACYC6C_13940 [Coriobacteriia bacterium]